jgi:hypothetical protein
MVEDLGAQLIGLFIVEVDNDADFEQQRNQI